MKITLFRDLPTEGWPSMERYADELTAALTQLGGDVRPFVTARPLPNLRGPLGAWFNYLWRSTVYPLDARRQQGDVYHILDHSYAHLIHALDPRCTVVTCHDLAPLALDQRGRGLSRRLWDHSFQSMLRAAHIVADSTHTRDEIVRHSPYPAGQITVVPLAVSPAFFQRADPADIQGLRDRHHFADRPMLLHVGSCQPRKNIEALLRAMPALGGDPIFVQIGGCFSPAQAQQIQALGLSARVLQIHSASERELRLWYQAADVFVFPSLYEGFGLPVLEAMASGVPVVCTNTSSLPEIADDAALVIDPQNAHALATAIRSVLTGPALRGLLRERGRARSWKFTWEQTARKTLTVYQTVFNLPHALPSHPPR